MKNGKEIKFPPFCCAGFSISWEIRFLLVAASGKVETREKFWTVPWALAAELTARRYKGEKYLISQNDIISEVVFVVLLYERFGKVTKALACAD
jgi:hypothetical protein